MRLGNHPPLYLNLHPCRPLPLPRRCRHPFTPSKLCAAVDEAKVHAAEHALQTLGLQTEGAAEATAAAAAAAFSGM